MALPSVVCEMVPFDRMGDFLLVFYSNFVRKTHRYWHIWHFDFKHAVTLKTGLVVHQGHWKCHHLIECMQLPIILLMFYSDYGSYLVLFLGYSMSKNVMTLKSGSEVTQGHWKWYHSIDCLWFPINVRIVNYTVTLKPGLGVTRGHQNRHVSICHLWLPTNIP